MALINREYHPSPPKEEPKWWEIRERLRTTLESRGWEPYQIQRWLGKNVDEFQRMNELREEAGMEPISGAYAMPHMLGNLDVGLGAVSLPAFTKTLGQATLPYAAMMGESVLAGTDIGRGMKEWPEDQPKDWRYALMAAGLPLSLLGGTMATRQLVSKIPPAPTPKGAQTLKQGEVDEMRRKILQGTAAAGALATIPTAGLRTLSKAGPTAAKVAAVSPVAGRSFMEMMGTNIFKPNINDNLNNSLDEFVYTLDEAFSPERLAAAVDEGYTIPHYIKNMEKDIKTSDKLLSKFEVGEEASNIKVFIDDNYNVTTTFKDLKKEAQAQAFGLDTIHRHLADQSNIIDIETIGHTGKNHFKNYGLKPDEIHIVGEYDFDGYVPKKDFTIGPGTQFEASYTKDASLFDTGLQNIDDFERYYLGQHGRKINKEVDPGIPYEAGDMGFTGINYYEIDGVPIAIGRYTPTEGGQYNTGIHSPNAIIMPNKKGLKRLTGLSEKEIGDLVEDLDDFKMLGYSSKK